MIHKGKAIARLGGWFHVRRPHSLVSLNGHVKRKDMNYETFKREIKRTV